MELIILWQWFIILIILLKSISGVDFGKGQKNKL